MKICVIQVNNDIIGINNRLNYIEEEIKKCKCDFVILPELSTSGYIPNSKIWQYAEKDGKITKKWALEMSKKYNIYLGAGFIERNGEDMYNSYLITSPDKVLGVVRKNEPESNIFKRGKFDHIIPSPFGNIAVSICLDSHKKDFYESIKDEEISLILMPHAWATDIEREEDDKKKILALITSYGKSYGCPVVFANAIGNVEEMAGITGKLMNPKKYKLNGNSIILSNNELTSFAGLNQNIYSDIDVKPKKRKSDINFYGEWIDKGSLLFRNVVIPLDVKKGIKLYNQSKDNGFELTRRRL